MRRVGWAITAAAVVVAVPLLASSHGDAATTSSAAPPVRAVLTLSPGTSIPYAVPGATVLRSLPHVGAELIRTSPANLDTLRRDPHVLGIARNWRGQVTGFGHDNGQDSAGVLAPQAVGGNAGQAGVGQGVTVALLDTGVDDTAALNRASGRLTDGVDVSNLSAGGDALTDGTFTDGYGHGTFMASLIAGGAVPGSGRSAIGIAPAAHIDVVKVADSKGRTSLLQVLAGLNWVAANANAIQVANLSLAVARPTAPAYGADPLSTAVELVRQAGVVVVAAAGNSPGQVGDPGLDPQALTVGAADVSTSHPQVTSFSGSGVVDGVVKPDVVAPGVHVLGVESQDTAIGSTNPLAWDRYGLFRGSGTSEATAITSGVAAAYLSAHHGASPIAVKTAIRRNATGMDSWRAGAGLVSMSGGNSSWRNRGSDPTGEAGFDNDRWQANSWLGGAWVEWLDSSWSASSWSASSWSASSWSASSWSASSWSASSWSDAGWGPDR